MPPLRLLAHSLSVWFFSCFSFKNSVGFSHRSPLKSELSDESDISSEKLARISRKKKKEKKKKRKHQHHRKAKRRQEQSSPSSGSESDAEAGKDRASRSSRDGQKEPEKPRCVRWCSQTQWCFKCSASFLSVLTIC